MKITKLSLVAFLAAILTACSTIPTSQMSKMMIEQKFLPYIPPQGNPGNYSAWNNYGPGVIMNPKNYNAIRSAEENLGKRQVKQIQATANDPKEREIFGAFSNKRVSGGAFDANGGWSFNSVAKIKGALNLKNATEVDVKFGNTYVAAPFSYNALQSALRTNRITFNPRLQSQLKSGKQAQVIFKVIYTESVTYYFKKTADHGGQVAVVIGPENQTKLQGLDVKGNVSLTSDGGVTIANPIIIGYVPVPTEDLPDVLP